jgi:hypothetical protein
MTIAMTAVCFASFSSFACCSVRCIFVSLDEPCFLTVDVQGDILNKEFPIAFEGKGDGMTMMWEDSILETLLMS